MPILFPREPPLYTKLTIFLKAVPHVSRISITINNNFPADHKCKTYGLYESTIMKIKMTTLDASSMLLLSC